LILQEIDEEPIQNSISAISHYRSVIDSAVGALSNYLSEALGNFCVCGEPQQVGGKAQLD